MADVCETCETPALCSSVNKCAPHLAREDVGTCWHCGGLIVRADNHVWVGSLVYHRGCAGRLRDLLHEALGE